MYYVLEKDISILMIGGVEETDALMGPKYARGKMLVEQERPQNLVLNMEDPPDQYPDYMELDQAPIVNQKVIDCLQSAGVDNYQVFPIAIKEGKNTIDGYSILNIVGRVSCIDLEKSEYTDFRGKIARMKKLVLMEDQIKGLKLFRPAEYELGIFVSEDVKEALSNVSGIIFREAENYSDKHLF